MACSSMAEHLTVNQRVAGSSPATPANLLGLGHPKTGTGFTANLLTHNGIPVGHEVIKERGMISWLSVVDRDDTPWGVPSYKAMPEDTCVFLVTRSPISSILSVIGENKIPISFKWRRKVILEEFGVDICSKKIGKGPVAQAVGSLFYWYELCKTHPLSYIYRVDIVEQDLDLSEFLHKEIRRGPEVETNSKPERHNWNHFVMEDLNYLTPQWVRNLQDMCDWLGYEQDIEKISEAVDLR